MTKREELEKIRSDARPIIAKLRAMFPEDYRIRPTTINSILRIGKDGFYNFVREDLGSTTNTIDIIEYFDDTVPDLTAALPLDQLATWSSVLERLRRIARPRKPVGHLDRLSIVMAEVFQGASASAEALTSFYNNHSGSWELLRYSSEEKRPWLVRSRLEIYDHVADSPPKFVIEYHPKEATEPSKAEGVFSIINDHAYLIGREAGGHLILIVFRAWPFRPADFGGMLMRVHIGTSGSERVVSSRVLFRPWDASAKPKRVGTFLASKLRMNEDLKRKLVNWVANRGAATLGTRGPPK